MKKLNKLQTTKMNDIKSFVDYAKKEYHPKCGLGVYDDGTHDLPFTVLHDIKFNRLGLRVRGWNAIDREKWFTVENSDVTKIHRVALKYDASFAYFLMCRDNTPESKIAYEKAKVWEEER